MPIGAIRETHGEVVDPARRFERVALVGEDGDEVLIVHAVLRVFVGVFAVHAVHVQQRFVFVAFAARAGAAFDKVAVFEIAAADLRVCDVHVVRTGVIVLHTQEAVALHDLQNACGGAGFGQLHGLLRLFRGLFALCGAVARGELPTVLIRAVACMIAVVRVKTPGFALGLRLLGRLGRRLFRGGRFGFRLLLGLRRFGNRVARGTRRSADTLLLLLDRFGGRRLLFRLYRVFRGTSALFRCRRGFRQHLDKLRFFIFAIGRNTVLLCKFVQLGDRLCFQFGLNHKNTSVYGF